MRSLALALAFVLGGCSDNTLSPNNGDGGADASTDGGPMGGDGGAGTDLPAMACDLVAQNCPTGEKCVTVGGGGMMATTQCVPVTGTVGEGMACMRMMGGGDNCAAGLICQGGRGGGMGTCRKPCAAGTDCSATQACTIGGRLGATTGVCLDACTPFGTTCGAMQTCAGTALDISSTQQNQVIVFTCRATGNTAVFGMCQRSTDCAANTVCDGNTNLCMPLCDNTHGCPASPFDGGGTLDCQDVGSTLASMPGVCG